MADEGAAQIVRNNSIGKLEQTAEERRSA